MTTPAQASYSDENVDISWKAVWSQTAEHLERHRVAGLENLLTEDVLRFAAVQELVAAGVSPAFLETEWRRPGSPDSVDLVVTTPVMTAVEFKYPREPRETNAAWTQHLGEVLRDFYRVATMPPEFTDRWCVQLWSRRVGRYFAGVADRHGLLLGTRPDQVTVLEPSVVAGLPATARGRLERWSPDFPAVRAVCEAVHPVGTELTLIAHRVSAAARHP